MSKIRILALGGLDESGKNLYCIEIDDNILIVNAGLKYPADNQYGVEYIVPDFTYLVENRDKVRAIILTHAHDDMMDAIPQLLKEVNVPVYGPKMCQLVLSRLLDKKQYDKMEFHELPRFGETSVKGIKITSFGLTHATPDAIGIAIDTSDGQIVIVEQFVIDFNMQDRGFDCDISKIADIGKKGVLCLLTESSYAGNENFTSPRHRITNLINPYFEGADGRIIITVYAQNYMRVKEILALARQYGYSVFFYDDDMKNKLTDMETLGYYRIPRGLEITREKFRNDIDKVCVLVSDNGQNLFRIMNRIATGEDETIELRESDTIIIASPVVTGTEKRASAMENELYKDNVNVYKLDPKQVLSVHPSSEDIKLMLNLLKPRYFIPVMGDYRSFIQAANLAMEIGITPDRIIILDNGQVAPIENGILKACTEFVQTGDNMVGEENDKNITSFVLRDRETLSTDGVIIIGVAVDFNTKEVIAGPDIQSRGVIYVKDSEYVIKNIGKMTTDLIEQRARDNTFENMAVRAELRESVARYVLRETGKRPMILPAVIEFKVPAK